MSVVSHHPAGIQATLQVINGFAAVDLKLETQEILTGHGEMKFPSGRAGLAEGRLYQSSGSESIGTTTAMYADVIDRVVSLTFFNEESGGITGAFIGRFSDEYQESDDVIGRVGKFMFAL